MKIRTFLPICAFLPTSISAVNAQYTVKVQFDSSQEVSGQKFAIRDIMPGLPANWDEFNFAVPEYKIRISQRREFSQFEQAPVKPRDQGSIPDLWNK